MTTRKVKHERMMERRAKRLEGEKAIGLAALEASRLTADQKRFERERAANKKKAADAIKAMAEKPKESITVGEYLDASRDYYELAELNHTQKDEVEAGNAHFDLSRKDVDILAGYRI